MPGLILKIGADVSDAQAALKSIVSDSQTTATKVSSAFGRTPIPTQNIANYNAAINSLKQNVSNVKFSLPDLPKLDTSIDLNTAPAITSLKSVVAEARTTEAKVISLFSTPLQVPVNLDTTNAKTSLKSVVTSAQGTKGELESVFRSAVLPTTTIDKYSAAITALKTNINSVSFTKLSNVPPVSIPVKVEKVIPQEIKVDTSKAIGNLSELNTVIKSSEVEIENLAAVSGQPLNTSSIDKYSAAIQSLKATAATSKIVPIVPSFDASSLSLENAIQKLDNFHRALNNATDPASIKLYEVAIASLETHIAKLNALKSGKPIIDLSGVQAQVAPASAAISQLVAQIEGLKSKALQKLQLLSTQTDIVEIRKLEAEINILLAEITKLGNNAKSIRAIQLPNLNLPLNNIQQYNAAINALKQNLSSVKISVIPVIPTIAPQKVTVDFSDVQKQAGPAIAAISTLGDSIETLRAKLLAKKEFVVNEKDITKVAILNKEIDILTAELTRLGNVGRAGFDAFGNKIIKTTTEIDLLAAQIKKGTGSFTVLGKAGKLSGSSLGSLTGVLTTTRSNIAHIIPQTDKLKAGFLNVAGGASKALGVLRSVAAIIPGMGIGAIVGLFTSFVSKLFETSDGLNSVEIASLRLQDQLETIGQSLKNLGDDLNFLRDVAKLKDELAGTPGGVIDLLDLERQKENDKILIAQVDDSIKTIKDKQKQFLAGIETLRGGAVIDIQFDSQGLIPEKFFEDENEKTKTFLSDFNSTTKELNRLNSERVKIQQNAFANEFKIEIQKNKNQEEADKKAEALRKKRISDYEKFVSDTISKARELSSFLEKRGVLEFAEFDIDPRKTKEQNFEKAKKFISDAMSGEFPFKALLRPQIEFTKDFSAGAAFENFSKVIEQVSAPLQKEVERLTKTNPILIEANAQLQLRLQLEKDFQAKIDAINETIKSAAASGIESIAEGIGQAFATGDLEKGFQGFASAIASGLQAIGQQFISIGIAALLAKKAFAQLFANPALAIAAGAALIAVGAGLREALSGGIKGLEAGGLVFGPQLSLIGEGAGTSRHNPEVVAPLDKLKSMLGDLGGNNRAQVVVLDTRVKGNSLHLIHNRTARRNRRLGA